VKLVAVSVVYEEPVGEKPAIAVSCLPDSPNKVYCCCGSASFLRMTGLPMTRALIGILEEVSSA